ncbi:MAG: hypothetical protein ACKOC8_03330 [Pirellulales bacterium]
MSLRSCGRVFERTVLRPFFRLFRRRVQVSCAGQGQIAELSARVERLESLLREQVGLQYLRIFEGRADHDQAGAAAVDRPIRCRDSA